MPRDASGNYTLPAGNPVTTGTIISPSWANPTMSDVAAALTASLSPSKLGGDGIAVRTSSSTWAPRTITGTANQITVTNGDGVGGNPVISLPSAITISGSYTTASGGFISTATNASIELGSNAGANTPFIDFHSGATYIDYDTRIIASGGTGSVGAGTLDIYAATLRRNGAYSIFDANNAPDLNALEGLGGTGFAVRSASNTWVQRSVAVSGNGLIISNGNGVSGNPTISLDGDIAALSVLGGTGIAVRTGTNTWAQRSVVSVDSNLAVTNGDGVSGNISLNFADSPTFTGTTLSLTGSGARIELGAANSVTPFIDFRYNNTDASVRLQCPSAASTSTFAGNFDIVCNEARVNGSRIVTVGSLTTDYNNTISSSSSSNGYVELPDGFYLMWGAVSAPANSNSSYSLPTTFPSAHYQAFATGAAQTATGSNDQWQFGAAPVSTSQVGICNWENSTVTVRFLCIGR